MSCLYSRLRSDLVRQAQVPTYVWAKRQFIERGILPADSFWTFLASSSVSGLVAVSIFLPPRLAFGSHLR